jgi:hypothetical protein
MRLKGKSAPMSAVELKRRIPDVAAVARDLYQIEFRKDTAHCPFPENHSHGDHDPSLRHDRKKNRLFCASQKCLGDKGVAANVRARDGMGKSGKGPTSRAYASWRSAPRASHLPRPVSGFS